MMSDVVVKQDFTTFDEFAKALKRWRGSGWIFFSGQVEGRYVELKTWNHTYMQIYRLDGANQHLSPIDCKVSAFNLAIARPFVA
jgi:hypothetical protein